MRETTPRVFLIGRTVVDQLAMREWLNFIGAEKYHLEASVTSAEQLVQLCGKRCYMSFVPGLNPNVQRVRTDMTEFIDNILKVGHGSVIEHAVFNFAIENVSRVFTGEMNRHRAGVAISEGSMRFIRFQDIPFGFPQSIRIQAGDSEELANKKKRTRDIFRDVLMKIEDAYGELASDVWKTELDPKSNFKDKKNITSMMRRIIPMGVSTGGVWSLNLRALRHVFHMRCDEAAEEEILHVATMMLEKMIDVEPTFFADFKRNEKGYYRAGYVKV